MKKIVQLKLVLLIVLAVGFGNSCHEENHHHADHQAHESSEKLSDLSLNNGVKWKTDSHTKLMMKSIHEILNQDIRLESAEYRILGEKVSEKIDKLISGCTMTGDSHAQLHVFLSKFIPAVKSLIRVEDSKQGAIMHTELKGLLKTYNEYFK